MKVKKPMKEMMRPKTRCFSPAERRGIYRAIYERRDVRSQFLPTPVPEAVLGGYLTLRTTLRPSVLCSLGISS